MRFHDGADARLFVAGQLRAKGTPMPEAASFQLRKNPAYIVRMQALRLLRDWRGFLHCAPL